MYYDPITVKTVELPSGYNDAWTNSLGEYILADDPSYNPRIKSELAADEDWIGRSTHVWA